ncbi:DNA recombination protein RmuC [Desulfobacula toluolica]|uniref:RmuC: DNA recombination protein rmuC homolog n=1 Tax=Desulfobacula toluolica (strain DSM 7467 / Tol2) TaxID=651182 RepID=K0NDR5_DESTT|nr:DNA recombination protein RmuC [Desulfobacula toluolica]CCK79026.1 RmuC: DNA recombination protein rmuC homolog [Desulfobacula toluolica Tol2]
MQNSVMTPENLLYLGIGFFFGVILCAVLAKSGVLFFSKNLKKLSNEALFDNSAQFMALADKYFSSYVKEAKKDFDIKGNEILRTVDPVRQTLDKYEAHLNSMEKDREKAYGAITEKLMEMGRHQALLHIETGNLVKALRVPHVRGRWGEITLKRVAELAGMTDHCDFDEQVSTGGGKGSVRPDMVVTLPENRKIVIDSKVPLMAYLDALEASGEKERKARMKDHARQVMMHITALSSKNYFQQISPTPEFVVLFIPGENFFSAALTAYPEMIEKGIEKGVVLATPTTLIALLKAVSYSWKQKKSYENAEEIRSLGVELFSRICSMTGNINRLGKDIEKCVSTYNTTVGAMETRVMSTARKLENLDVSSQSMDDLQKIVYSKMFAREFNNRYQNDK